MEARALGSAHFLLGGCERLQRLVQEARAAVLKHPDILSIFACMLKRTYGGCGKSQQNREQLTSGATHSNGLRHD